MMFAAPYYGHAWTQNRIADGSWVCMDSVGFESSLFERVSVRFLLHLTAKRRKAMQNELIEEFVSFRTTVDVKIKQKEPDPKR